MAVTGQERARIVLGLLQSVERSGTQSQRSIAAELGIALGLVNAYLKHCISKGLVRVRRVPARRYAYFLTPSGFAEKSRLTVSYLTASLHLFRQAKADFLALFETARQDGISRVVLAGRSDIAEIAIICAIDASVTVVAVVDPDAEPGRYVGVPLVSSFDAVPEAFEAVVVTDLADIRGARERAAAWVARERVLVPGLLDGAGRGQGARP